MSNAQRDRGAVLPLVLVLIVFTALVAVPMMRYTASVLKANSVVSDRTQQLEAAKGGLRAALGSPKTVFETCAAPNVDLDPQPTINGYVVDSQCWLVDDVGSIEALSGEIPIGSTSMQLGAEVPGDFVLGVAGTSDSVSAGGTATDWWDADVGSGDLPTEDEIWLPHLPREPTVVRTSVPFDMPPTFGCQVFFPGYYPDGLDLSPSNPAITEHDIYFASGVYYFGDEITVGGDIDVVVGYGTEDFGTTCADDIQVAANVTDDPGSFAIDGGGATWVLGGDARLVVDDSSGSPSLRFNQRYAGSYQLSALPYEGFDRGRRINIMTVNGDERIAGADHDAAGVTLVPRSWLIASAGTVDEDDADIVTAPATISPIDSGSRYAPSSIELTDAARQPAAPANLTIETYRYDDGGMVGAALLTWDAVVGQDAGGALITGYDVVVTPPPSTPACPADEQVTFDDAGTEKVACLVRGLTIGDAYDVEVVANNTSPVDPASDPTSAIAAPDAGDDELSAPAAPESVSVGETAVPDEAKVSWSPPADDGGAPITRYDVTATRVFVEPQPDLPPVAVAAELYASPGGGPVALRLPVYDPNGDPVTLTKLSGGAPKLNAVLTDDVLTIDPDPTTAVGDVVLTYDATDDAGNTATGQVTVRILASPLPSFSPVAAPIDVTPDLGVETTVAVPAFHPGGTPLTDVVVGVPTAGYEPTDWPTLVGDPLTGTITITTTAADGTYEIPYEVSSDGMTFVGGLLTVTVSRSYESVGACTAAAAPPAPLPTACSVGTLPPLPAVDGVEQNLGYRFDVVATSGNGVSGIASSEPPYSMSFDGGGTDIEPFEPSFEPHAPTPVIEILAGASAETATVFIPGYVSVPMGTISISNPAGDPVSMTGGVVAGSFDVPDTWTVAGVAGGTPIGFWDQIILQRTVRIVTTAGNARSVAIVQVNRDNDVYGVNSWTVQ
jgi:hypothetical protein